MIFIELHNGGKFYLKQGNVCTNDPHIELLLKGVFFDFILKNKKCLERLQQGDELEQ